MNWRLICPKCDRRTFHDEVSVADPDRPRDLVKCRACGDSSPLSVRKGHSREEDPNPDRRQRKLGRWSE